MTNRIADTSQNKAARVAGLVYLLTIIPSLLLFVFVDSKITVEGNVAATINNMIANQLLSRIGPAYEIIMYTGVVILSLALYVTLKPVNKNLALLALLWRFGEAIIGGVVVLCLLVILLLINDKGYSTAFNAEQLQALAGLLLDVVWAARMILFVFISLGSIVFFYLFFKSNYIPRILAAWGIFTYMSMLIYAFVYFLLPNFAEMITIFALAPGSLFEIVIGFWLLFKGVNVEQWEKRALESA